MDALPLEGDTMKRSTGPHNTAPNFSESVQQHLNMYALAASAAGVSLLALAQPTEARIVYTPANVRIGMNQRYALDLNHDGITDFTIDESHRSDDPCHRGHRFFGRVMDLLDAVPFGGGVEGNRLADALTKGMSIGPSRGFYGRPATMARHTYGFTYNRTNRGCWKVNRSGGDWVNVTDRYLGLKFINLGKTHYGWARLSVQIVNGNGIEATLTGYAYENIAGKSIKAGQTKGRMDDFTSNDSDPGASVTNPIPHTPQPASLGVLALGARGVPLRRREEATVPSD